MGGWVDAYPRFGGWVERISKKGNGSWYLICFSKKGDPLNMVGSFPRGSLGKEVLRPSPSYPKAILRYQGTLCSLGRFLKSPPGGSKFHFEHCPLPARSSILADGLWSASGSHRRLLRGFCAGPQNGGTLFDPVF